MALRPQFRHFWTLRDGVALKVALVGACGGIVGVCGAMPGQDWRCFVGTLSAIQNRATLRPKHVKSSAKKNLFFVFYIENRFFSTANSHI